MNFIKEIVDRYKGYYYSSVVLQRFAKVLSLDVLVRASNLFLLPVYLKLMTQEEFGLFGYFLSIISVFSTILNFGLYLAQAKLYHDYNAEEKKSFVFTINVMLIAFLSITVLPIYLLRLDYSIIPVIFSHPVKYELYRDGMFLAIVVTVLSFMLYNFLMTSENIRKFQVFNFIKLVTVNSVIIYLLSTSKSDSVMIRLKYSYIIELFIFVGFSSLYIKHMKPNFNFAYAKKALVIGIPAMASAMISVIYTLNDRVILEKYGNFADLGIYNFGVTYAAILMVIFSSFQSVYLPRFFQEKDVKKNFHKTKKIISKMGLILAAIGVVLFIILEIVFTLGIINIKYQPVMYILPVLLVVQIAQASQQLLSNYVIYFEMVYIGTLFSIGSSILNIGLNLIFIPKLNFIGAAFSSLIISLISLIFYYYFVRYKCLGKMAEQP